MTVNGGLIANHILGMEALLRRKTTRRRWEDLVKNEAREMWLALRWYSRSLSFVVRVSWRT